MLTEEHTMTAMADLVFSCHECNQPSRGLVMVYQRKPYYFGISLGTQRQVLLKCDTCGAEHLTTGISANELADLAPEAIDRYVTKIKSPLFAKLLIVLLGMTWFMPLIGLMICSQLRPYREYIRRGWRNAYKGFLYLTILCHVCWVPYLVYMIVCEGG